MKSNDCASCGGKVEYSPDDKALKCTNCSKIYKISFEKPADKRPLTNDIDDKGYKEWENDKRAYQCKNCGAQIILNKFDMATTCQYCNTSSLTPIESLPGLKPDAVIPFKISKSSAKDVFQSKIKTKRFLPNEFKKHLPTAEIGATYISSFSFACDCEASYHGRRVVARTRRTRDGKLETVYDHVPFSGHIKHNFDNIVVESSDKLSQNQIESVLPYNFTECYAYDDSFMRGYNVGYYDQTVKGAYEIAKDSGTKELDRIIRSQYSNVESLTINANFSNEKYEYVLLPLYFINFKYKDKDYFNLMNGQTGKVGGKVPRSAVKIACLSVSIALIFIAFIVLFFCLGR